MKDIDTQRFKEDKQQTPSKVSQFEHPGINRDEDNDGGPEGDLPAGIKPRRINTGDFRGQYTQR